MRIGACQTPEILGDLDVATGTILDFAAQADQPGLDLLLFPECFLQGYLVTEQHVHSQAIEFASPRFTAVLTQLSGVRQMLVLGMIERHGGSYHNTAAVITGGQVVGSYRKRFLTGGESVFTAGGAYPVFTCRGLRFGINICHDTRFPQRWQERHNRIRVHRVRETGMWLASADVTGQRDQSRIALGPTCLIAPPGHVVTQVPRGRIGIAIAEINPP